MKICRENRERTKTARIAKPELCSRSAERSKFISTDWCDRVHSGYRVFALIRVLRVLRDASANAKMGEDHSGSRVARSGKREVSERNWTSVTHLQPYCSTSAEDKARVDARLCGWTTWTNRKQRQSYPADERMREPTYVIVARDFVQISFLVLLIFQDKLSSYRNPFDNRRRKFFLYAYTYLEDRAFV